MFTILLIGSRSVARSANSVQSTSFIANGIRLKPTIEFARFTTFFLSGQTLVTRPLLTRVCDHGNARRREKRETGKLSVRATLTLKETQG